MDEHEYNVSCCRKHLRKRAFERLGIALSDEDMDQMVSDVKEGRADLIETGDNWSRNPYLIECQGVEAVWIYDKSIGEIVTVVTTRMYVDRKKDRDRIKKRKDVKQAKKRKRRMEIERSSTKKMKRAFERRRVAYEW